MYAYDMQPILHCPAPLLRASVRELEKAKPPAYHGML